MSLYFRDLNPGLLFQVIEILQTSSATDLFSPELQKDRNKKADPVANDLLGALLSVSWVVFSKKSFFFC